jgi:hypothetical protein
MPADSWGRSSTPTPIPWSRSGFSVPASFGLDCGSVWEPTTTTCGQAARYRLRPIQPQITCAPTSPRSASPTSSSNRPAPRSTNRRTSPPPHDQPNALRERKDRSGRSCGRPSPMVTAHGNKTTICPAATFCRPKSFRAANRLIRCMCRRRCTARAAATRRRPPFSLPSLHLRIARRGPRLSPRSS